MSLYRSLLVNLSTWAEGHEEQDAQAGRDGREQVAIGLAFARLVDSLAADLVQLYQEESSGRLSESDRLLVLPALERMRNVLRRAQRPTRSLRDTLRNALEVASVRAEARDFR